MTAGLTGGAARRAAAQQARRRQHAEAGFPRAAYAALLSFRLPSTRCHFPVPARSSRGSLRAPFRPRGASLRRLRLPRAAQRSELGRHNPRPAPVRASPLHHPLRFYRLLLLPGAALTTPEFLASAPHGGH